MLTRTTVSLMALVLALAEVSAAALGRAGVAGIGTINSIADLRQVSPIPVDGQWEIRLGLADSGPEGGPWKLLYCLARYTGSGVPALPAVSGTMPGEPLGPVYYRYSEAGRQAAKIEASRTAIRQAGTEVLFCVGVQTAHQGSYDLEVVGRDGTRLAYQRIEVAHDQPCYWVVFAQMARSLTAGRPEYTVGGPGLAAMPTCTGLQPIWPPKTADPARKPAEDYLPGRLPPRLKASGGTATAGASPAATPTPSRPITLSLEGSLFRISSGSTPIFNDVELMFLARWWVNGKPVAGRTDLGLNIQRASKVMTSRELQVAFGLPEVIKGLKPGDSVGLQVVYCPLGWEPLGLSEMMQLTTSAGNRVPGPLLSNRIDFPVTAGMLALSPAVAQPTPATTGAQIP